MITTWQTIYATKISEKGGLSSFILNKEKRSAGALINRLRKNLKYGSKILEVGTGTGAIGALLIKYGFDVTGIDIDTEMLKIAQKSFALFGKPDNLLNIDAKNVANIFKENSFDCVISHGMLEHYSNNDILLYLNDQLKISPLVVFVVPMKAMSANYKSKGFGNERYLSTKIWKKILKDNFYIKNIFGFGIKETNNLFIHDKIIKINLFAKIFAPFCAFNEFWITQK
jgi:2-polyprenyl-3-methyl-5-hydroxy-6-metoxy-1,4-benzoquinol methylase